MARRGGKWVCIYFSTASISQLAITQANHYLECRSRTAILAVKQNQHIHLMYALYAHYLAIEPVSRLNYVQKLLLYFVIQRLGYEYEINVCFLFNFPLTVFGSNIGVWSRQGANPSTNFQG